MNWNRSTATIPLDSIHSIYAEMAVVMVRMPKRLQSGQFNGRRRVCVCFVDATGVHADARAAVAVRCPFSPSLFLLSLAAILLRYDRILCDYYYCYY